VPTTPIAGEERPVQAADKLAGCLLPGQPVDELAHVFGRERDAANRIMRSGVLRTYVRSKQSLKQGLSHRDAIDD
jgi:hypothetical protein